MPVEVRLGPRRAASTTFASHHGLPIPVRDDRLGIGAAFSEGTYGALHPLELLDGTPPGTPLVVKVFKSPLPPATDHEPAIAAIADLHAALTASGRPSWPDALLALPYCVYEATVSGERTIVGIMLDLRPRGYSQAPFLDSAELGRYQARPLQDRVDFALRFVERAELLEAIRFVHGDINPENLLVNLSSGDVQIIDFDCGTIVSTGSERPRTPGKPNMCMPPEVKGTGVGPPTDLSAFTPGAERWSVASLVGYFLLGFHPAFFLRVISRDLITAYARGPERWPDIDVSGPLFTDIDDNRNAYPHLRARCSKLPPAVRESFERFFGAGLDGDRRPTAPEWRRALEVLIQPPEIELFGVDDPTTFAGRAVRLQWRVIGVPEVEITGLGTRRPSGSELVVVDASTVFTLRAVNPYGNDDDSVAVRVLPLPRMEFVPVPDPPSLRFRTSIPMVGLDGDEGSGWVGLLHRALAAPADERLGAVRPAPVPLALGLAERAAVDLPTVRTLSVLDVAADFDIPLLQDLIDQIPPAPKASTLLHGGK